MSRVIKFRAWNEIKKSFEPYRDMVNGPHICLHGHYSPVACGEFYPVRIEQFTGLVDRNGKEIYEEDIVRVQGWTMNCTIVYHFGGFACAYSWTNKDRVETAHINMAYFAGAYLNHLEVIGNVHENPELLK